MRSTGEHVVIDDGNQTIMMEAIDPAALGRRTSRRTARTAIPTATTAAGRWRSDDGGDPEAGSPTIRRAPGPPTPGGARKRQRRR